MTRSLLLLPLILLGSCASDSGTGKKSASASASSQAPKERSVDEWVSETSKDNGFKKDANGNLVPKSDKRSPFESKGQDPNFAGKDFKKKEYRTGDYAKKSWWGNKDYGSKQYAGNTDGSRFQKNSGLNGKGARESGNAAKIAGDYKTGDYATNSAREAGKKPITKHSNDGIENRKEEFEQPDVIGWKEQRSMSIDKSKGFLGH